jgi:hypothetical protein
MQCGQLDGKRVGRADLQNCISVQHQISFRVLRGARGFTQHVEGKPVRTALVTALHRVLDGLGEHELSGEDAHRLLDGAAHHRLAQARDQALQKRCRLFLRVVPLRQRPGQHQRPVRGAGGAPVAAGELVADQGVGRIGIRDAQERFGHAHQRHALRRGQPVAAQE